MTMLGEPTVIPMSMTCPSCGQTVTNDMADIKHPLDFLEALRQRGWFIPSTQFGSPGAQRPRPHACPKCASSF